ncbi:MAG: DUF3180 domain-containing protein [Stackebrandtia sp.]
MTEGDNEPKKPSLKPTAPSTLLVAALAAGALMLVLASRGDYPPIPRWYTPVTLLLLSFILAYTAYTTRARIEHKAGAKPVEPLLFARFAALAKASSIGGAIIAGAYAGVVVYLFAHRELVAAGQDLPVAAFGFVSCLVLVAAALWLERACRIPEDPDDEDPERPLDG